MNYFKHRLIKYTGHVMKITHTLQQKVIGKYKDILEHQLSIIEAQQQQIEKLMHLNNNTVFLKNEQLGRHSA